nr:polyketide synthase [Clostridium estertheticum]
MDKPYDFDPLFFGMFPSEATVTDPQQRIFLEVALEALEQVGYGGRHKSKSIGVFVGCEQSIYEEHFTNYRTYMELKNDLLNNKIFNNINDTERKVIMASILNVLQPAKMVPDAVAARVSHCIDLTGPSLTINSACSSSLSALHLACESIRTGDSQMPISGGVNLNLSPTPYVGLSRISALSKTGICYPFDGRADGMVLSEGSSAILLKPLVDAILDKDNIMAVIKGSAIDNDGHSQGITEGQAEAIRKAEAFSTEYALGVLLSRFDLKIYGMIAQGTGIAAAAVLTGLITLDQAIIDMNINDNQVESIITVFAKLYTLGSRYNPSKLFYVIEKKVPLPTYPFRY